MKELSIEEKARRYDEAIEIAKDINNEQRAQPFNIMTRVFPELAESEDERMKKAIIATIHLYYGEPLEDEAKKMIAWLEKQGEKAKYHDICDKCVRQPTCQSDCLLQQDKQKSSWSEEDEMMIKFALTYFRKAGATEDSDIIKWLKSLKNRVQPQPRQEWSEKDEKHINSLLERLKGLCKNEFTRTTFAVSEDEDWLKSLRNRVLPQAKQEWSEEDEQTFIESVEALEDFGKFELADWLKEHKNKFLKPQSQWKPSDEQIETLEKVIGYSAFPDAKYCVELKRLLEQLKAL